jgi:hypothetical protein
MKDDSFYVGYERKAQAPIARKVRIAVIAVASIAIASVFIMAFAQRSFEDSYFEIGKARDFEGVITSRPFPRLLVTRPGTPISYSHYTLTGKGKHGVQTVAREFDGRLVRLRGKLIYRDGITMIELEPDTVVVFPSGERPSGTPEWLGPTTLRGEIVDSKCYLGMMNPGHTKIHRDCAARCISSGIPPMFVVQDPNGGAQAYWLVMESGRPIGAEVIDKVGEPLEIAGEIRKEGDQLFFRADPGTYKRVQ